MQLRPDEPSRFNPLAGNPLLTRADVAAGLTALYEPLEPCFSKSGARVSIDGSGAVFDRAASELEGFARPLWGMAALMAQDAAPSRITARYRAGLTNGTDRDHPDYWGEPRPYDQRLVEIATLGMALCLARAALWEPLDDAAKARLIAYLVQARAQPVFDNNWHFFPLMIDLALRHIGAEGDDACVARTLKSIDVFYLGDGWYHDGSGARADHYNGFAFHFYGLLYAALGDTGSSRAALFRERATAFAQHYIHWFADDGAALPFGRSLTYRFAGAAFFGACAFAGLEALPWAELSGFYLRHLRWWRQWPITRADGILSIGYGYPNALMAENYNAAASPCWAFKAFLPLALSENHAFWASPERALPPRPHAPLMQTAPGMLIVHEPGNTVALSGSQSHAGIRSGAQKYSKFAYSTRYAFSIESEPHRFDLCSFDNMIALANAEDDLRIHAASDHRVIRGDIIFMRWRAWNDVIVESWLYWQRPWHVRIHRISTPYPLRTIEGGFGLPRADGPGPFGSVGPQRACCETSGDFSGIVDLLAPHRAGRVHLAEPNSHLLHPRTIVPQLTGQIPAGQTLLGCAVIASPDIALCKTAWAKPAITVPILQPL